MAPAPKRKRAVPPSSSTAPVPESNTAGVVRDKNRGKWVGRIYNQLTGKHQTTALFTHESDCVAAVKALRAWIDVEYISYVTSITVADPMFDGVPMGPADAAEVEEHVVYWRPNRKNEHKPFLAVRQGRQRVRWKPVCKDPGCTNPARQKGTAKEFCDKHGGGERRLSK